jgi:hypothetical protein
LLSAKPTEGFDPKAPIGGANVPFQETKGVGGYFRRLFGDTANEQNVAAQQAQAAEWKASDLEQQKEDRLIKRMQEADKPQALRFERQLAENKAIREGEQTTRKAEREQDRADRLKRETGEAERQRQEREDRLTQWREENAIKDAMFGQNQLKSNQPQMIGLSGGGMGIFEPRSGSVSIVNPGTTGFGTMPGTPPITRQVYPQPKAPVNTGGGAQVNRADGSTMGAGPLPPDAGASVTPMRSALMPMDESNRPSQRMVPVQEEENIDPYQLQRTTPSMGTMMEPAGSAARRRARYLSPNMPGWSLGQ